MPVFPLLARTVSSASLVRLLVVAFALSCAATARAQQVWGVNGHPDEIEYLVWGHPEAAHRQFDDLDALGCTHYRVSFSTSKNDPRILDHLFEPLKSRPRKISIVPVIFADVVPSAGFQRNYDAGFAQGHQWALHAREHGYEIAHWEIGNETSLATIDGKPLFVVDGDPTDPASWHDNDAMGMQGATEAMAGVLRGLYWGIKTAYAGSATAPHVLFGDTWLHFGYVQKLKDVRGAGFLPADILSWHWYAPGFGRFGAPVADGRPSPAAYAARFGKPVWITEVGREDKIASGAAVLPVGGSADNVVNDDQNWAKQADALAAGLHDLLGQDTVQAVFAYQLYDEPVKFAAASQALRSSQAYHGLVNHARYRKTAFDVFRQATTR